MAWGHDPADPGAAASAPGRRYVVAAMGDSLTDTRVGGGRYLEFLRHRCPDSQFDAYGVGGQRTDHMRWRLTADLFGEGPWQSGPKPAYTHVIILGGVNDLVASPRGYGRTDSIRQNLSTMWRMARERGLSVIAMTVPPWTAPGPVRDLRMDATTRLNEWMVVEQQEGRVDAVVDIHERLLNAEAQSLRLEYRRYPSDFIHWSEQGHRVVGEALFEEVFSDCR